MDGKQYRDSIAHLSAAEKRLPTLKDYPAYLKAAAEFQLHDFDSVEKELKPVWDNSPSSPLAVKAIVLQANVYIQSGNPKKAIDLLEKRARGSRHELHAISEDVVGPSYLTVVEHLRSRTERLQREQPEPLEALELA